MDSEKDNKEAMGAEEKGEEDDDDFEREEDSKENDELLKDYDHV